MKLKLSHLSVKYQKATESNKRCGVCSMYVIGKTPHCTLVRSPIHPQMVCNRFVPKEKADAA